MKKEKPTNGLCTTCKNVKKCNEVSNFTVQCIGYKLKK